MLNLFIPKVFIACAIALDFSTNATTGHRSKIHTWIYTNMTADPVATLGSDDDLAETC